MLQRITNILQYSLLIAVCSLLPWTSALAATEAITVRGDVLNTLTLTLDELRKMPSFHINNVTLIHEKAELTDPDKLIGVDNYHGVLLRDLLERAGMKHIRKWEPGVIFRVKNTDGREVVFSFGEIFYSSIGRSVIVALEKSGKSIQSKQGIGELIVATDVRAGRRLTGIKEIVVERVEVSLQAYEDKKKNIIRPPTSQFTISDRKSGKNLKINMEELGKLPSLYINDAVMTGDCEGFRGVPSFEGPTLKLLVKMLGVKWNEESNNRLVLITSEDGFCATFSLGEIFNSRLSDNIIIAYKKNDKLLEPRDGFAMSVVREDSAGGRSVKRIQSIEIL
jgi:DMSO/TMAO reductase YedYZ molybdopterin-dependent catalytic subunit